MRVLCVGSMYPPHHLGGYELMWRGAVEHLRASGHEVRVLASDYRSQAPDPDILEAPDVHRELRWYWRDHAFPRLGLGERRRLERHNAVVLARHLHEVRPDIVAWWAMGGMSISLIELVRRRGIPAVGFVIDDWMVYGRKVDAWQRAWSRLGPLAGPLARLAGAPAGVDLDRGARWVFVSEVTRSHARGAGWELPGSALAPGGVDPTVFAAAPVHDWQGKLLYVGRLDRRKGVHVAIAALAELPGMTLRVVGAGDEAYARELRRDVDARGLEARVRFDSVPRRQLAGAYAEADVLLFPVLWEEPWGLVPLEAMSTGTPVVASGSGGSAEYLCEGENCLIYAPRDDPAALASSVRRLQRDEALRGVLRAGGMVTAGTFTEERFNASVAAALDEAVGR